MTFATRNDFICYTSALLLAAGIGHTADTAYDGAVELADKMEAKSVNTWTP